MNIIHAHKCCIERQAFILRLIETESAIEKSLGIYH